MDVECNTAYTLSTQKALKLALLMRHELIGLFLPLGQERHALPETTIYLVTDGYYSKRKFAEEIVARPAPHR